MDGSQASVCQTSNANLNLLENLLPLNGPQTSSFLKLMFDVRERVKGLLPHRTTVAANKSKLLSDPTHNVHLTVVLQASQGSAKTATAYTVPFDSKNPVTRND